MYFVNPPLAALCVLAAIAGTGYGLIFSAAVSGASGAANPDRTYAFGNGGALILLVVIISALPLISRSLGPLGTFVGLVLLVAGSAPLMLFFRGKAGRAEDQDLKVLRIRGALALVTIWFAFSLGTGAVYTFAERIGHEIGLPAEQIGYVLSAGTFAGLLGTGVAAWLGRDVNRMAALVIGLAGSGASCFLIGNAWGLASYAVAILLYWIFYMYLYSYLLGTAAILDPVGRLGTLGSGFERFAFAVGAPIGGLFADVGSFGAVGYIGLLGCCMSIPLCLTSLRRGLAFAQERSA
jgi:predicted MFS family arabinose efflux permease